jgi:hypothetical protein
MCGYHAATLLLSMSAQAIMVCASRPVMSNVGWMPCTCLAETQESQPPASPFSLLLKSLSRALSSPAVLMTALGSQEVPQSPIPTSSTAQGAKSIPASFGHVSSGSEEAVLLLHTLLVGCPAFHVIWGMGHGLRSGFHVYCRVVSACDPCFEGPVSICAQYLGRQSTTTFHFIS